jgi:hypothetical protein
VSASHGDRPAAFRTRRGRCVVDDEEIRLEENLRGHFRTVWETYNRRATVFTHVVASLLLLAVAASAVFVNLADDPWADVFNVVFAFYVVLVVLVVAYFRFVREEGTERIPHADVLEIRASSGGGLSSPPRFVVVHHTHAGVQRRVVLPTTPGGDDDETYEVASRAFRAAGHDVVEE